MLLPIQIAIIYTPSFKNVISITKWLLNVTSKFEVLYMELIDIMTS